MKISYLFKIIFNSFNKKYNSGDVCLEIYVISEILFPAKFRVWFPKIIPSILIKGKI